MEAKASIWALLMALPTWFQIVVILIIAFLFVLLVNKGIVIAKGKFGLIIGNGTIKKISPHKNCPYKFGIIIMMNKRDDLRYEKWYTEYVEQIKEQMNYAEQKADQIVSLLTKKYLSELEDRRIKGLVESDSYKAYCSCLKEVKKMMLLVVRNAFKENHFDEKTEQEYKIYREDKISYLINTGIEYLNSHYYYNLDIKREELYLFNQNLLPSIKSIIADAFDNARQVSIDNKVKILKLNEELEKLTIDTLGDDTQ